MQALMSITHRTIMSAPSPRKQRTVNILAGKVLVEAGIRPLLRWLLRWRLT
jgi:hypothetical protein